MGRKVIYPQIDFCAFPEALCAAADDNLRLNGPREYNDMMLMAGII